ncbi:glycoside hydrolase family 6 protein [Streptomyces sp. WMMC905]|uniref:glycoside hydrolase family 6 protein n=1 Tax=Streptomyces sp. WMMC905 TaxID=3404123 RepID=UPI003B956884
MVAAASIVVAVATATGVLASPREGGGGDGVDPEAARSSPTVIADERPPAPNPVRPVSRHTEPSSAPSAAPRPATPFTPPDPPASGREPAEAEETPKTAGLYRHPDSRVLDWVRENPDDPRLPRIVSEIADRPAAVWFADYTPDTITERVRAVTSGGEAEGRVPVVVPYAIPDRDCGGHSLGGAPDLAAYDDWIDLFAAGLGSAEVIVVLEPDAVAQAECLTQVARDGRFASLARAGRVFKEANPRARVYFDAGHSGWHAPDVQAAWLRGAGAASPEASDGVFTNVSNFHTTADEVGYAREVLEALGGPESLGAVVDTSRNGNGPPADGAWCDPEGRALGRPPTLTTGEDRVDAYLWIKLPGESDGCLARPGTFSPEYAGELAG